MSIRRERSGIAGRSDLGDGPVVFAANRYATRRAEARASFEGSYMCPGGGDEPRSDELATFGPAAEGPSLGIAVSYAWATAVEPTVTRIGMASASGRERDR